MDTDALVSALAAKIPTQLASDIVRAWVKLRMDTATQTLEKATAGKFVETFVQVLEFLETQKYSAKPDVDSYLRKLDDRPVAAFGDDLRICAARQARAMYTLRNKRNIAHKNDVDPNVYDQRLLYSQTQWILTELLRFVTGSTMTAAGKLIEQVQMPVSPIVEQIDSRKLVLLNLKASAEILILLHHAYPNWVPRDSIVADMDRRPTKTVANELVNLWRSKNIEKNNMGHFKLTSKGFAVAEEAIRSVM
jgi:hypothetical protein